MRIMKEYKVGEQIVLEVKETIFGCEGCFFSEKDVCHNPTYNDWAQGYQCQINDRSDGKNIIFVEKKGK